MHLHVSGRKDYNVLAKYIGCLGFNKLLLTYDIFELLNVSLNTPFIINFTPSNDPSVSFYNERNASIIKYDLLKISAQITVNTFELYHNCPIYSHGKNLPSIPASLQSKSTSR